MRTSDFVPLNAALKVKMAVESLNLMISGKSLLVTIRFYSNIRK